MPNTKEESGAIIPAQTIGRFCRICEHSDCCFCRPASMETKQRSISGAANPKNLPIVCAGNMATGFCAFYGRVFNDCAFNLMAAHATTVHFTIVLLIYASFAAAASSCRCARRFFCAVLSISLIRLSWFTSLAPGS